MSPLAIWRTARTRRDDGGRPDRDLVGPSRPARAVPATEQPDEHVVDVLDRGPRFLRGLGPLPDDPTGRWRPRTRDRAYTTLCDRRLASFASGPGSNGGATVTPCAVDRPTVDRRRGHADASAAGYGVKLVRGPFVRLARHELACDDEDELARARRPASTATRRRSVLRRRRAEPRARRGRVRRRARGRQRRRGPRDAPAHHPGLSVELGPRRRRRRRAGRRARPAVRDHAGRRRARRASRSRGRAGR